MFNGEYEYDCWKSGIYTWKDGRTFEGSYENNKLHGEGFYTIHGVTRRALYLKDDFVKYLD